VQETADRLACLIAIFDPRVQGPWEAGLRLHLHLPAPY